MSDIKNNTPAFPCSAGISGYGSSIPHAMPSGEILFENKEQGMTLLDYFAAKAMQALIEAQSKFLDRNSIINGDYLANSAYIQAVAMMRKRASMNDANPPK